MNRFLTRNISSYATNLLLPFRSTSAPNPLHFSPICSTFSSLSSLNYNRLFSSEVSKPSDSNLGPSQSSDDADKLSNQELKLRIDEYFKKGNEEALPSILEAILQRRLTGKHEETDDEVISQLQMQPLDGIKDQEFESDFEDAYETDEEIEDLYNARDIVTKRMVQDEYFNMDDRKWDDIIKEATEKGYLKDTKECEEILEDMLSWDKLLPG